MSRYTYLIVALAIALGSAASAFGAPAVAPQQAVASIVFSGNDFGEYRPCPT